MSCILDDFLERVKMLILFNGDFKDDIAYSLIVPLREASLVCQEVKIPGKSLKVA